MTNIIKGTTPTLIYKFKDTDVADITAAYLTMKHGAETVMEKDLSTAIVDEDSIAWRFTQAETLALGGNVSVMLNWLLDDGTRGASEKTQILVECNYKESEI